LFEVRFVVSKESVPRAEKVWYKVKKCAKVFATAFCQLLDYFLYSMLFVLFIRQYKFRLVQHKTLLTFSRGPGVWIVQVFPRTACCCQKSVTFSSKVFFFSFQLKANQDKNPF
jgi:hypothetical protein